MPLNKGFDFVAIDFETADKYIPCSLGLVVVRNSHIECVKNWLIKPVCFPYFHFYAQRIHGIHKEDVEFKPCFDELWEEIKPFVENTTLVAHNALFDINVLRKTLLHYHLPKPRSNYFCSYQIARKVWTNQTKYSLDFLCNQQNIVFEHHKSDQDAVACAKLFLRELEELQVSSFTELKRKLQIRSPKV
ncbi:MAG: 3'-5' exonuclease [Bacteroidales bacterium]|jgi:DNA polymerase-3 subunit epsilon|nr:3'-5' exonuclease [Bacteroidales bacterium]